MITFKNQSEMNSYILNQKPKTFSFKNIQGLSSPITILYGGKTGNAAFIAEQMRIQFQKYELEPAVYNMTDYDVANLENEKYLFIVVSTRGEGDPPSQAKPFYKHLLGLKTAKLDKLNYSVCALGDSSYAHFCQTGKDIDVQLSALGANKYSELITCDVAFNSEAENWTSLLINKFQNRIDSNVLNLKFESNSVGATFTLKVKDKYRITNEKSSSEIQHLVLQTDHPDFNYYPGDSISIKPKNPYSLVVKIMILQDYTHEIIVRYKDKKKSIEELLATKLELTCLNENVLRKYLAYSKNDVLQMLCENEVERFKYLQFSDVHDMLSDFPSSISAQDLCEILNKIQRREYSISSSIADTPNELHLTVKQFNYSAFGRDRVGACSTYINKGLRVDSIVKAQIIPNEDFRLPEDDSSVIMVGAGTGIAPYLAFLRERRAKQSSGKCWLIFGEKQKKYDYLYEKELNEFQQEGVLNNLDVAFSRDQKEKVYVQNLINDKGTELLEWLKHGAHFYVCGSIEMGREVKKTVIDILTNNADMTKKDAINYFESIQERYHEDLY